MKVLLLTGILIMCFTPVVWSQGKIPEEWTELDSCMKNITSIDQILNVLKNAPLDLLHLNLCKIDLLTINKNSFKRFKYLLQIDLDENYRLQFNSYGSEFLQLESLTDLQCIRCGVDKLYKKSQQGMPKLDFINLTHNKIEDIEIKSFHANTELETIDLLFNKLRQ